MEAHAWGRNAAKHVRDHVRHDCLPWTRSTTLHHFIILAPPSPHNLINLRPVLSRLTRLQCKKNSVEYALRLLIFWVCDESSARLGASNNTSGDTNARFSYPNVILGLIWAYIRASAPRRTVRPRKDPCGVKSKRCLIPWYIKTACQRTSH